MADWRTWHQAPSTGAWGPQEAPIATGTYNPDWNKAADTTPGPSQAELDAANNTAAMDRQKQQQQYESEVRQRAAIDTVKAAFDMYGLQSLYSKVEEYARQGLNSDAIILALRSTPEYKARFPAMEAMNKAGRAISEGAYVDYEKAAATMEQRYGLPKGMILGQVTDLLTNDVSAEELNDRVTFAVADSIMAPQDLRDTLRDYYGLDPDTALKAYYLDPKIAMPILEKQSAAARIGAQAGRQGLSGVGVTAAEELQGLGVTEAQAGQGFARVAGQTGLTAGKGDTASQDTLIAANLKGSDSGMAAADRAARGRRARFEGGGSFAGNREGTVGIGSSTV